MSYVGRLLIVMVLMCAPSALFAGGAWGLGWDDGVTLRYRLDGNWEASLAAGPDDYLDRDEVRLRLLDLPPQQQGALEVPLDTRQEQGWVRAQLARRAAGHRSLSLLGYCELTYNWIDYQERSLTLDPLVGQHDTYELDRFTGRWILGAGIRPRWRAAENLSVEAAFGLAFTWEHWDQTVRRTYAGVDGADLVVHDGYGRRFNDRGWDGLSSLAITYWF